MCLYSELEVSEDDVTAMAGMVNLPVWSAGSPRGRCVSALLLLFGLFNLPVIIIPSK